MITKPLISLLQVILHTGLVWFTTPPSSHCKWLWKKVHLITRRSSWKKVLRQRVEVRRCWSWLRCFPKHFSCIRRQTLVVEQWTECLQKLRIQSSIFCKLSPEPKSSDLLIRWLQTSRRALQKLRIESSISVNTTKSTMGQVNHPFSGGKTLRKWTKIFCGFVIHIKNTFCKKNGQKR